MLSRILTLALLLPALAQGNSQNAQKLESIETLNKFAFGSCNSAYHEQPLWSWIVRDNPQLWIWGGDNVYADTDDPLDIQASFQAQNAVPGYQKLKRKTPVIGTWDDHDYGYDNGEWDNPMKHVSQDFLLDFLEEPEKSPRRTQEGVYTSYTFGPPEKRVKIILLDNRFHLNRPDEADHILGEAQWKWFENEIKNSDAKIHFIVSGLSVFSYMIRRTEEWIDHPQALDRMRKLLKKHEPAGAVFLTGDKHFASVFQHFEHLEFMSSGLTHTVYGRTIRYYVSRFYPNVFFGLNYGLVEIDWDSKPLAIKLSVKTYQPNPVWQFKYILNPQNRWEKVESLRFPVLATGGQTFSF